MSPLTRNNVSLSGTPGKRPVIFAHGFGCDSSMWRFLTPHFAADYRIVAFDHVGAGHSDLTAYDPERYASLDGYAADVIEICETLDLHDAVFVGHSVAAMMGVLAAAAAPERIGTLVLVAPSPRYINDGNYHGGFEAKDIEELLEAMDGNYLGWSVSLAPSVIGTPGRPDLDQELTESFCKVDPRIARQFASVTFLGDNREDLAKVPVPTLVLQCSDDMLAPLSVGAYVHDHIKGSRLVVMEATGHCPHLSAPQETVDAITAFLAL